MKAVKQISIKKEKYNICDTELRKVLGGSAQEITLSEDFDINNYTKSGIYHIKGERINNTDNMPNNVNTTIDAILQVLKNDEDICVTQILSISNSNSNEGNGIYTRTGCKETNKNSFSWNQWAKLQTNIELGNINNYSMLETCINNGIYSGVVDYMPFIMFVINYRQHISQFMYSVYAEEVNFKYRKYDTTTNKWSDWKKSLSNKINYSDIINSDNGEGVFAEAMINADGLSLTIGSIVDFNNEFIEEANFEPKRSINIKPGDVNYNKTMISFNRGNNSISLGLNTNPNQIIINGNNDITVKIGNEVDINNDVNIGENVNIGKYVDIGENVNIGQSVDIANNVFLHGKVSISTNVNIDENISINYSNNSKGITINGVKKIENENNEYVDTNIEFKIGNEVNIDSNVFLHEEVRIGSNVNIDENITINYLNDSKGIIINGVKAIKNENEEYVDTNIGFKIGNEVNIGKGVNIGEGVNIGQNVTIGNNLKISTVMDSNKQLILQFSYTDLSGNKKTAHLQFDE